MHLSAYLSAFVPSLGWALLDFVWQGMLVGWAAALVLALLRHSRPQARYLVGCAALCLCAALPVAGVIERMAEVPRYDGIPATTTLLLPAAHEAAAPSIGLPLPAERLSTWRDALAQRLPLVILLWAVGAAALALRMGLGLLWVRRRRAPANRRAHAAWQACADRLAHGLGIARRVSVGLVEDLPGPVTAGWWHPVVLIPVSLASGMPPQLLEALLAHELAHVRRHDYLVNLIQSAIEVLLFYHPTVWWLSGRVRIEREQIADDLAASLLGEPRRLALALSELDRFQLTTPNLAPAAHGGNLMSRIKRLVRPTREPLNWKMAIPAAALPILGLTAALAVLSARAETTPAPAPAAKVAKAGRIGHHVNSIDGGEPYAIVRAEDHVTNMNGDSGDWKEVESLKKSIPGEFVWFRDGGKSYVIRDAATVKQVISAWSTVDTLSKEINGYGDEMKQHGEKMKALGEQMRAAAEADKPKETESRKFEQHMKELSRDMEKMGRQVGTMSLAMVSLSGKERAAKERELEALEAKMQALGAKMEAEGDAFGAKFQSRNGSRMEEVGKQMD
ncbi:MAG TPA: M56 family metallopeptidase, partial [Telluria sp.]|nr:M56 family metallopeptidase [Telluria sp.]